MDEIKVKYIIHFVFFVVACGPSVHISNYFNPL